MTREEILAKSRNENKSMDEREQQIRLKASAVARYACVAVNLVLLIITIYSDGPREVIYASWSIYWSMMTADYLVQAISTKNGERWASAIFSAAALVFFCWKFVTLMVAGR